MSLDPKKTSHSPTENSNNIYIADLQSSAANVNILGRSVSEFKKTTSLKMYFENKAAEAIPGGRKNFLS